MTSKKTPWALLALASLDRPAWGAIIITASYTLAATAASLGTMSGIAVAAAWTGCIIATVGVVYWVHHAARRDERKKTKIMANSEYGRLVAVKKTNSRLRDTDDWAPTGPNTGPWSPDTSLSEVRARLDQDEADTQEAIKTVKDQQDDTRSEAMSRLISGEEAQHRIVQEGGWEGIVDPTRIPCPVYGCVTPSSAPCDLKTREIHVGRVEAIRSHNRKMQRFMQDVMVDPDRDDLATDQRGVSPVVATVLMVAIAVVAAGTVWALIDPHLDQEWHTDYESTAETGGSTSWFPPHEDPHQTRGKWSVDKLPGNECRFIENGYSDYWCVAEVNT